MSELSWGWCAVCQKHGDFPHVCVDAPGADEVDEVAVASADGVPTASEQA